MSFLIPALGLNEYLNPFLRLNKYFTPFFEIEGKFSVLKFCESLNFCFEIE